MRRLHRYFALAALLTVLSATVAYIIPPRHGSRKVSLRAAETACRLYMDRYAAPR